MDFDLGRSPSAATVALRYVEDLAHRVSSRVTGAKHRSNPVAYLIRTHRRVHGRRGDAALIRHGYHVAELMHRGQTRKSGEPYITHPVAVAQILADLGMDSTTLVAALLHDTVEDTAYTMRELHDDFGGEIARLVDGVTKFEKVVYGDSAEMETLRKLITTAGSDVRVLIIKLADRLHNMRTIGARSMPSRVRIARATQEVFIPLCDRLGLQAIKRDLEDSVFAAITPEAHADLESWVAHRPEWTRYTDQVVEHASTVMKDARIRARVVARPHHLYSIWRDSVGEAGEPPFEPPRIAIIVDDSENHCYTALGEVHSVWRPVPGRFKDFIASPKNNLYRSLHTTVIGPDSRAVEVLIRTESMHRNAEYGIAAAFRYSRKGPGAHSARGRARSARVGVTGINHLPGANGGAHMDWLHRLLEWQQAVLDPVRFLDSLRSDLAERQVHVFVDGLRLLMPAMATPVDVAYALGAETGDRCVAASINGQLAILSSPLTDGDVVEIHTAGPDVLRDHDGRPVGPSPEWLTFVRTPSAKLQIERRLGGQSQVDPRTAPPMSVSARVRIGRSALGLELRRRERGLASGTPLTAIAGELGFADVDSLFAAIADHTVDAATVVDQLIAHVDVAPVPAR